MFCFHRWEVASKEQQASAFDQLSAAGMKSYEGDTKGMFKRDFVITYRCRKCGKEKVERV